MQVNRQTWLLKGLRPDQAASANIRFHHKPVRAAMCTMVVGNDHNYLLWMEKSLDQFSVSNGDDDTTTIVTTDDAPLGLAANHRVAANCFPHSPATAPSIQWYQSDDDQHSCASHSAPFKPSATGSKQWDCQGGARPKTKCPAIPSPPHVNADICKGLSLTGIAQRFIARHTQDDYYKNPEKVAAVVNNRIVPVKSCMSEPFTGYGAWPPYRSLGNGRLSAHNRVDRPPCHVQAGSDYHGLPLETQQSANPQYSASTHQQWAGAIANSSTGVVGAFLSARSGSGHLSYSRSSKEVANTTDKTGPAMSGQPVDEPASEQSEKSSDVFLTSTASCNTAADESGTDESLTEPEQQVATLMELDICDDIEEVLKKRQEHKEFEARIKQYEDEIKADRKRIQQAQEARELEYAKSWPAQQDATTIVMPSLCKHFRRRCRVKFECCDNFYACHGCHNDSKECSNEKAIASEATHYKCNKCDHEEKIDENSQHCSSCKANMAAYFCSVCKHFTSTAKNPFHCEKCGICRVHKDKSFHCDVCNVCLDKGLENKHICRPNSGDEKCGICLEDAFSGCQILPCSHKVHLECAEAMIENGIRNCPICRHDLYSPSPDQN